MSRSVSYGAATFLMVVFGGAFVLAAGEGQEDLDKATEAKLDANTVSDLAGVIRLAESALLKGLDEPNTEFAKKLLASTLIQRGSIVAEAVFKSPPANTRWVQYRNAALSDLEKAVTLDPKHPQALLLIAQLYVLPGGDPNRAREAADRVLAIEDADPLVRAKALIVRANLQKEPEAALADLDEAVQLVPGDADAVRARGELLARLGKLDASLADLDKAIELDPDDARNYEAKAIVLARLKRYDESLDALDKTRQLSPESVMPLIQSAQVHSQQEKPDAAMDDLNQALTMDPNNVAALLLRAWLYQEAGDQDKALADAQRAVQLKPDVPVVIRTRVALLAANDKLPEATEELERLRKLYPNDLLAVLQLSVLYGAQKQFEKAIEMYTILLAARPDEGHALRGRGDAYLSLGKQAEAIADYNKAIEIDPKDSSVLNNLAWVLATSPDEKLRDGKRAIQLATEACELTEYNTAHILSTLAAAYAESGDFETAVRWSTKAVEASDKEHVKALKKELESYQAGKPWRELLPEDEQIEKP